MLSSAFEHTVDHVLITDVDGVILYVNPAFEKMTGYKAKEAIGQTPCILKSGKHGKAFYKNLWDTILAGKTFQGTLINKRKNGSLYYADQTIAPIQDESGRTTHFFSLLKDITDRIQAQIKLDELNENLNLLSNARTALINNNHDSVSSNLNKINPEKICEPEFMKKSVYLEIAILGFIWFLLITALIRVIKK